MRATVERPYAAELPEYLRDQKNKNKPRQEVLALNLDGMLELTPQGETKEEKLTILAAHFMSMKIPDLHVSGELSDEEKIMAVLKNRFESLKGMEMLGMLLTTTGGGLGLLLFGPLCERIGRRNSFLLYHLGGLVVALVLFQVFSEAGVGVYWTMLPIFGFLTLGMHAGYAI
jgi:MFS family permease